MNKNKKIIISVIVLMLLASVATWYFFLSSPTYTVNVCTKIGTWQSKKYSIIKNLDHPEVCVEEKPIAIIKGTEKYSKTINADNSVRYKCAALGAEPVSNFVGGVVGSEFLGCTRDDVPRLQSADR